MAGISVSGMGSGLDVNSIVSQLVSAERAPVASRLSAAESKAKVKLSAYGSFRSAMAGLQAALKNLSSGGTLGQLKATPSDSSIYTASTLSTAKVGSYSLEVVALAKANKLSSAAFATPETSVGTGDVTLTVDGQSFTVSLTAGNDSVYDLRDAINNASDNTGVNATIINEVGGSRLMLTARQTGESNAVSVSTALTSFTEIQPASDAHIRVDGYDAYSAVNSVSGVIDGVTLNLVKAAQGTSTTLDVGVDKTSSAEAVQKFVTAYNDLLKTLRDVSKFDAATNTASALTGDVSVRSAQQMLRGALGSEISVGGSYSMLSQIGITTNTDGSLKVDSSKLESALGADFSSVQKLFGASGGFATNMDGIVEGFLDSDGRLDRATDLLQDKLDHIADQREALDRRLAMTEARYRAQFTSLDTLMSQLQSTSSFLSSQLANLSSGNS